VQRRGGREAEKVRLIASELNLNLDLNLSRGLEARREVEVEAKVEGGGNSALRQEGGRLWARFSSVRNCAIIRLCEVEPWMSNSFSNALR
jgi:hypothetical protein